MGQSERTSAVAGEFEESWSRLVASPGWWPAGPEVACRRMLREATDLSTVVNSAEFRSELGRSLRRWRAFRGVPFEERRLADALRAVAPMLPRWRSVSVTTLRPEQDLFELFDAVREVKPTERKWVVTSKLLHHLLPDLIVPMDNLMTAPFLGRSALPATFEPSFLAEAYAAFADLATSRKYGIGARRLRQLGKEVPYPLEGAARVDCRVGQARILDFAIAGYWLSHGGPELRTL